VASLSQGRTAAAQCGLFTHKSVPVIFEPPCIYIYQSLHVSGDYGPIIRRKTLFMRHLILVILCGWLSGHVQIDKYKYTKNKLCNRLVLFTRLYRDARSTKHKIRQNVLAVNATTTTLRFGVANIERRNYIKHFQ